MFGNYFKIAFRNLTKYRFYSFINITGLAIGMAACLLILLYVQHELNYDRFHSKAKHIYRLNEHLVMGSAVSRTASVPLPTKNQVLADFPEITTAAYMFRPSSWGNPTLIRVEDSEYTEESFLFTDPELFEIFDFPIIIGDRETMLTAPNQVLLDETTARKYFGDSNPVGRTIRMNNRTDLEVVGVMADIPDNSHMKFHLAASMETFKSFFGNNQQAFESNWVWVAGWCYLLLPDEQTAQTLREQLPAFVKRHFPPSLVEDGVEITLQPMTDIHLHSNLELEFEPNSNILYVYVFSAIAILILLIACINFMNLATARSAKRAKEVGLRKVLGAYRQMLMKQFIGEAMLLSGIALIFAVMLVLIALPWFNELTGRTLQANFFSNGVLLAGLLGIGLLVGLISGSYPALYLSGMRPVEVLKGTRRQSGGSISLRRVLVIGQFVVSIALLICIGVIYNQLDYLRNKDLGFEKEQVVMFNMYGNLFRQYPAFKNELLQDPGVLAVTRLGGSYPGAAESVENSFVPEGAPQDQNRWIGVMWGNHHLQEAMKIELAAGRSFSLDFPSDSSSAFLINETAAREFGWSNEEALGQSLNRLGTNGDVVKTGKVIGVVRNFHFRPLHLPLRPLVIDFGGNKTTIKIAPGNVAATLAHIEKTWKAFVPEWPLSLQFLDKELYQNYQSEENLGQIVQYFSALAILIACLGLFGLASFTAERRTKEMGVRKVLGASTPTLIRLIATDFATLVLIAFVIAAPLAYLAMDYWLDNFAFRTTITPGVFLIAGTAALIIALLTVSYHALRAASVNPARSLRYE